MKKLFLIPLLFFLFLLHPALAKPTPASCLSCHVMKGWEQSQHALVFGPHADRACLMCHTRHPNPIPANAPPFAFLRGAQVGGVIAVHNLCFQCHASSVHHPRVQTPNIYTQFDKIYLGGSAMPLVFVGHKPFLGPHPEESLLLGSKPDELPHIECTDCHDPHFCNRLEPLRGAKGIDIAGDPVGFGTKNPRVPHDYEVCFRCHGDTYRDIQPFPDPPYRLRPPSNTNKRAEFNPETHMRLQPEMKNESFHPVAFPGKNKSNVLEEQLSKATRGKLGVGSVIRCVDCHNNDAFAGVHGTISAGMGTFKNPEGPHGSLYKRLLRANYSFKVGDDHNPPFTRYNPKNFTLCFNCHDQKAFDGGPDNQETGFYSEKFGNLHYLHLTGEGGKLPSYESCMECHYNVHSNVETDTTLFVLHGGDQDTHLLWFYPGVKPSQGNAYPAWISEPEKKSCAMVCHAHRMNYTYGGPRK